MEQNHMITLRPINSLHLLAIQQHLSVNQNHVITLRPINSLHLLAIQQRLSVNQNHTITLCPIKSLHFLDSATANYTIKVSLHHYNNSGACCLSVCPSVPLKAQR